MSDSQPPLTAELDQLFAAARKQRPETARAEFAFETRLLSRLREQTVSPAWPWARMSWRLIPALALMVLALTFWEERISDTALDAQQLVLLQNPDASDILTSFN